MKAYILINIRTGEALDVIKQMKRIPQLLEVNMTFGEYDAIAVLQAEDLKELGKILAGVIQPIPGVEDTLTCLAVDV